MQSTCHTANPPAATHHCTPAQRQCTPHAVWRPQTEDALKQSVDHWKHIDAHSRPIPRVVHQTWKSCTLPSRQHEWLLGCAAINKGWRHHLWTDKANHQLVKRLFPELLDLYNNYNVHIKRVDAVRLLYLYAYGGVYMDIDFACLKPLEDLPLPPGRFVAGYQERDQSSPQAIANAFMAAPPRHPFVAYLIQQLNVSSRLRGPNSVLEATGPAFITRSVNAYRATHGGHANLTIHAMPTVYPFAWDEKNKCGLGTPPELAACKKVLDGTSAGLVTFWTHKQTWARYRDLGCGAGVGLCKLTGPLEGDHVAAGLGRLAAVLVVLCGLLVTTRLAVTLRRRGFRS